MRDIIDQFRNDTASLDRHAVWALCYCAVGLTAVFYLKSVENAERLLSAVGFESLGQQILASTDNNLLALSWWIAVVFVFYFIIPAVIIRKVWKLKLADFGLKLSIEKDFFRIFSAAVLVMSPLLVIAATNDGFLQKYPFLRIYNDEPYIGQTLLVWEAIYFIQFLALEFFFRGFLVHSLRRSIGIYSIFVMTVPYCMIHFGKPAGETFSAIVAGIFLGWLSYRNGSIWLGLTLHCVVAFSMDILSLYNKGLI